MERRQFLQMIGLGGISLGSTVILPLFSGKESKIWTPEHTSLTASHLVLTRPVVPPEGSRWITGVAVDRRLLNPNDDPSTHIQPIKALVPSGGDPHEAFYQGALKLRDAFANQSLDRLLKLDKWDRQGATLVTLVDTPIFAGGFGREDEENLGEGFLIEISYNQYVIHEEISSLNGWGVYSENGEYPIEIPTDIDLDRLISLDVGRFKIS